MAGLTRPDPKALAKKNLVQVPPTELTACFTRDAFGPLTTKRVFFIVHSDSEVDEVCTSVRKK